MDNYEVQAERLVVCDPRKNALMKQGNKSDKIDARKLADLLRGGYLCSVYHGENGLRTVKELARSYLTISKDLSRVMNRVKALCRSWGILCGGQQVYAPRHRSEWLNKIGEAGVRRRAEFFYQQLDALRALRQTVRRDLLAESRKHSATKLLRQIPGASVSEKERSNTTHPCGGSFQFVPEQWHKTGAGRCTRFLLEKGALLEKPDRLLEGILAALPRIAVPQTPIS
jgi:hypothetical protein